MNTPSRAATSRLNVNLDRSLHRAFKLQAFNDDATEAAIVRRLITLYLEDPGRLDFSEDLGVEFGEPSAWSNAKPAPVNTQLPPPVRAGLPTAPPVPRSS